MRGTLGVMIDGLLRGPAPGLFARARRKATHRHAISDLSWTSNRLSERILRRTRGGSWLGFYPDTIGMPTLTSLGHERSVSIWPTVPVSLV